MPATGGPTGLERITALEVELREMRRSLDKLVVSHAAIEKLLIETKLVGRLGRLLIAIVGFIVGGIFGHERIAELLKWLGS